MHHSLSPVSRYFNNIITTYQCLLPFPDAVDLLEATFNFSRIRLPQTERAKLFKYSRQCKVLFKGALLHCVNTHLAQLISCVNAIVGRRLLIGNSPCAMIAPLKKSAMGTHMWQNNIMLRLTSSCMQDLPMGFRGDQTQFCLISFLLGTSLISHIFRSCHRVPLSVTMWNLIHLWGIP